MQFNQIETITIKILQDADEKFLFPYQIFNRIRKQDPSLGRQIEVAYPTKSGKPVMGEGAGIYYSAASFIAQALRNFKDSHVEIKNEWLDSNGIEVEGTVPGNKEATSIWAWKEST